MQNLITVSEAARRLNCAESTVRRLADTGQLTIATRLADGSRLFTARDVDATAAQRLAAHKAAE
jgi:excisionase family DNA binding protein